MIVVKKKKIFPKKRKYDFPIFFLLMELLLIVKEVAFFSIVPFFREFCVLF